MQAAGRMVFLTDKTLRQIDDIAKRHRQFDDVGRIDQSTHTQRLAKYGVFRRRGIKLLAHIQIDRRVLAAPGFDLFLGPADHIRHENSLA